MSEPTPEPDPAEDINEALVAFTACVGESIPDICSYGLTHGEAYVPFNPDPEDDCDEEDAQCSQLWVRVVTGNMVSFTEESFESSGGCATGLRFDLEVGILRCFEIPEDGEAIEASDAMVYAMQAMSDMKAILCAAMECEVWHSIVAGQWAPEGPLGGQFGGRWMFTVELI